MKRLAVIDGKSVFYRGYYAMPGLSLPDGTPTGGVFGFASIAIELIKKLEPDYVAVAWDIKGTSVAKRLEIFSEYKAGRTKPADDFYAQLPIPADHDLLGLLEKFPGRELFAQHGDKLARHSRAPGPGAAAGV